MNKLKVLYTIPNFDTAGSGKVLYDLAKGLDKERFEVHIASGNSKGIFFKEVESLGFPIHIFSTAVSLTPYLTLIPRTAPFRQFLKNNQFDVVHSWHWSSNWSEVMTARLSGCIYIYTKKAMTWNRHWKIKSFLSDFVITINEEMRSYFPHKKQKQLIPLGLDTDYYNPDLFNEKSDKNNFKIITVANLVPVKGIEILIQSIKSLNSLDICLEILGDDRDPYADKLKQQVKDLGMEQQVSFLGKHNDVRPFLAQADLYIIPTLNEGRKEGMPMALVEAMAMGIPVLGSDISGINFVLKDFQEFLFEASNSKDLGEKICLYLTKGESERREIGLQLREYCVENFSMVKFIEAHELLYLKLVRNEQ